MKIIFQCDIIWNSCVVPIIIIQLITINQSIADGIWNGQIKMEPNFTDYNLFKTENNYDYYY